MKKDITTDMLKNNQFYGQSSSNDLQETMRAKATKNSVDDRSNDNNYSAVPGIMPNIVINDQMQPIGTARQHRQSKLAQIEQGIIRNDTGLITEKNDQFSPALTSEIVQSDRNHRGYNPIDAVQQELDVEFEQEDEYR